MGFSLFTDLITPTSYSVPSAPQIDTTQEQLDTQTGNLASFNAAKGLASSYNDFMQAQVAKQLQAVPGFTDLSSTMAKNLAAQLRGEISTSDAAASQRSSAARALGLGIGGSQSGAALTARNLGLTQYQVQQNAQAQTPGYLTSMSNLTRAPMYDFSNVFLSPMQRISVSQWNKTNQWNVQNLRNQMAVQPAPWERALAGLGDSSMNLGGILGSAYAANYFKGSAAASAAGSTAPSVAAGASIGASEGAAGGGMSY